MSVFLNYHENNLLNYRLIQALSGHENIIRLQHVIKAENDEDIYLTFDHMETGTFRERSNLICILSVFLG